MPDVREKLVELLRSVPRQEEVSIGRGCGKSFARLGIIADHLIANGVTFAEDTNVLTNGVTIQRWIPVTERLPSPNKLVLCWWQSGDGEKEHYGFATFQSHGVWYVSNEGMPEVTHWMPLPDVPKVEK